MVHRSDKRKFVRFNFQRPVFLFPVVYSKSGNIYEVQTEAVQVWANNISEGGLRLENTTMFDPTFPVKLFFDLVKGQRVEIYGKIVWTLDQHCGIRFMGTDDALISFLRSIKDLEDNSNQFESSSLEKR